MSSIVLNAGIVSVSAGLAVKDLEDKCKQVEAVVMRYIRSEDTRIDIKAAKREIARFADGIKRLDLLKNMADYSHEAAVLHISAEDFRLLQANLPPR